MKTDQCDLGNLCGRDTVPKSYGTNSHICLVKNIEKKTNANKKAMALKALVKSYTMISVNEAQLPFIMH